MPANGVHINHAALRAIRRAAGMSVRDLAAAVGMHENSLFNIEAGRRMPSAEVATQIADVLGVSRMALLDGHRATEDVLCTAERAGGRFAGHAAWLRSHIAALADDLALEAEPPEEQIEALRPEGER